jgi:hypothetical protein
MNELKDSDRLLLDMANGSIDLLNVLQMDLSSVHIYFIEYQVKLRMSKLDQDIQHNINLIK